MGMTAETELQIQLALYQARMAAREGKLEEALRLLDELDTEAPSVAVLDLRARLHAQRGEFAEADRCWARVQELVPDDREAAEGRRTIEEILAGRRRGRPLVTAGRAAAAVLACAVLAGGAAVALSGQSDQGATPPMAGGTLAPQEDENARRVRALEDRLAAIDAERAAAAGRRAQALDAIAEKLAMPGVLVQRRDDEVRVLVETGVFGPDSTVPSRQGRAVLLELGRRLAELDARTTVVGHAVAVPGGPASGGSLIALDRAQAAASLLAEGGGLPLTAFTLVSADQQEAPFPDSARNRTVTLLVAPARS